PHNAKSKTKEKAPIPKTKAKAKAKSKGGQQQTEAAEDAPAAMVQTGLILANEDLEELYPILRKGSKLRIVH
ncbi:MAG: hypothetical protein JWO89_1867, partial [Verrucomicrobiaceae bacterium]|nr:hypothetical protein [Verrucomicrobiaceae bacterium]